MSLEEHQQTDPDEQVQEAAGSAGGTMTRNRGSAGHRE